LTGKQEPIMRFITTAAVLGLGLAGAVALTTNASAAGGRWTSHHPARTEILGRAAHQSRRIAQERQEGDLTAQQARRLHAADAAIAHREQVDARANDGHLTAGEVHRLNRAEDAVGNHIPQ
jgi:hypothetical protein